MAILTLLAQDINQSFGSPFGGNTGEKSVGNLLSLIISLSLVVAGLAAFFLFIWGGFFILTGAGQGNAERAAKGQRALTSSAIGFIIVFSAYWIIRLIELVVGSDFITAPGI